MLRLEIPPGENRHISVYAELSEDAETYSRPMNEKFSLSSSAALIADPARAAMLTALLDARARSAGELARVANCSAQSASMHLSQLLTGGFLSIANDRVAHAVEVLGTISTAPSFKPSVNDRDLCFARTCYDHLAGELGVKL